MTAAGLWLASGLLLLGVLAPVITVTSFWVVDRTYSIAGGVAALWRQGEWLLALLIAAFSMLNPAIKLALLHWIWLRDATPGERARRSLGHVERLAKWSMLDVFVVALLVVVLRAQLLVSVEVHYGIYCFAAAAVLTPTIAAAMRRQVRQPARRRATPPLS